VLKLWTVLGAIHGCVSVACGAFGAHGLRAKLTERMLANWETGARYQMYHALALLAVGSLAAQRGAAVDAAGVAFNVGIVLFSGSLYAMALTGSTRLGAVTPFGGVGFLVGWVLLARAALR